MTAQNNGYRSHRPAVLFSAPALSAMPGAWQNTDLPYGRKFDLDEIERQDAPPVYREPIVVTYS